MPEERTDPIDMCIRALRAVYYAPDPKAPRLMSQHHKRPRDPNQLGKLIIEIATGEVEDRPPTPEERGKDAAAASMGRRGGVARAEKMTPERRKEIAKQAAQKRWGRGLTK